MKKSLIALAVAGALTAPMVAQADATLYGSLRVKVTDVKDQELDVADNSSRIGIKGSVDTNIDGVKAVYRGEWKVNSADGAAFGAGRLAYVGLTGGFGTAAIGQQWTPYYLWGTGRTDILDGNSTAPTQEVFRTGNAIAYISPDMSGLQVAGAIIADDNASGEDVDLYNVAIQYTMGGFNVAASLLANETADDSDMTVIGASYSAGPMYVAAIYQDKEAADVKQWELAGSYAMGNTKFLANYADLDEGSVFGVEVQQKLAKQSRVFVNYMVQDEDAGDNDTLSLGMRVDF